MPSLTAENLINAIPTYIAAQALPVLESNLFMASLVNRDYDSVVANAGDTIDIPVAPSMAANNIAETGTVTAQALTLGNIAVTLNKHIEATFTLPDVSRALTNVNLLNTFLQPAMLALATQIETDLLAVGPLATYNAAVGSSNTAPTEATIDSIETAFFKANVNPMQSKYLACSADFYAAIRQISRFSERRTIGNPEALITGEFGELKGINFFRSQLIQPVSTTTNNLAFTSDGIALVVRKLPLPMQGLGVVADYAEYKNLALRVLMSYNPSSLAAQITVDVLYGVAALRNQALMQVLS